MNPGQTTQLWGIEAGLCQALAAGFRFPGTYLSQVPLVVGRHLFASTMKDAEEILANLKPGEHFDSGREPVVAFFDASGGGSAAIPSSSGVCKHDFPVEVMLRVPQAADDVKKLLGMLVAWMKDQLPGQLAGDFRVKGVVPIGVPSGFQRIADGMVFSSMRLRILCVPTLT